MDQAADILDIPSNIFLDAAVSTVITRNNVVNAVKFFGFDLNDTIEVIESKFLQTALIVVDGSDILMIDEDIDWTDRLQNNC